jgi:hypothetical protein
LFRWDSVTWIETHKNFFLATGALLAPFAAVFIGLVASRMQAAALLKSTRMQIQASALRDYRQRNVEKLREEIAAELFDIHKLRSKHKHGSIDDPQAQELINDGIARKIRIRALRSSKWRDPLSSEDLMNKCFDLEDQLLEEMQSKPWRNWTALETFNFDGKMRELATQYIAVPEREMRGAAESI